MVTLNRRILLVMALLLPLSFSEIARGAVQETEPNNSIAEAQNLESELWSLESDPNIGDMTANTSTTIPHVTILGTGDGTFDYFAFAVASAGARGIFDIDFGTTGGFVDAFLNLYDSGGVLLASDDDASTSWGAGGSTSGLDSYLEFTFSTAGTYYIEVGRCCVGPVPLSGDYQLQVSIENHPLGPTFAYGRIVYLGIDPSDSAHAVQAEARILAGNAARWAGRGSDPKVAYCDHGGLFDSEVGVRLAEAGLTDLTEIPAPALAGADLSGFDVLYVGPSTDVADFLAARQNILAFGNFGGGLVVEPNVVDEASWSWVPFANEIGQSGATNIGTNGVFIFEPAHPVMAGLSDGGLSNWGSSVHSIFSLPEEEGFQVLAEDQPQLGAAVIIVRDAPSAKIFADGFESGDTAAWSLSSP